MKIPVWYRECAFNSILLGFCVDFFNNKGFFFVFSMVGGNLPLFFVSKRHRSHLL